MTSAFSALGRASLVGHFGDGNDAHLIVKI